MSFQKLLRCFFSRGDQPFYILLFNTKISRTNSQIIDKNRSGFIVWMDVLSIGAVK
jgi:hypothetical protein